jgi:hypothetical protein
VSRKFLGNNSSPVINFALSCALAQLAQSEIAHRQTLDGDLVHGKEDPHLLTCRTPHSTPLIFAFGTLICWPTFFREFQPASHTHLNSVSLALLLIRGHKTDYFYNQKVSK